VNDHAAAIAALLAATPNLLHVYDGPPRDDEPPRTPPYVTFYVHVPYEARTRLNQTGTDETWITVTTHSVAGTMEGARIVAANVRTALVDVAPTVEGWACGRLYHESGSPPDWDSSTGALVADQVDQWDYRCKPIG
jgi:hypothetical protein